MTILDSSIWIALFNKRDTTHAEAVEIFKKLEKFSITAIDHIYAEVLTILSKKVSREQCKQFLAFLKRFKIKLKLVDAEILTLANFFFFHYHKLSFVDCLLLAYAKRNNIKLLTFDKALEKAWNQIKK